MLGKIIQQYMNSLAKLMPPAPEGHADIDAAEIRRHIRPWHAIAPLIVIAALFFATKNTADWLWLSPLILIAKAIEIFTSSIDNPIAKNVIGFAILSLVFFLFFFRNKHPNKFQQYKIKRQNGLRGAALHEEQIFREGSEHWSFREKAHSALIFGLVHVANLYVPFIIALCILAPGGAYLQAIYTRAYKKKNGDKQHALLKSAAAHYAYNIVVFGLIPVWILLEVTKVIH